MQNLHLKHAVSGQATYTPPRFGLILAKQAKVSRALEDFEATIKEL